MLNQVLVKCTYNEVKKYINKQVKAFYENREVMVYFRVVCDETNFIDILELCKNSENIIAIDYIGDKNSPCYRCLPYDMVKDNYIISIFKVDNLDEEIVKQIIGNTPNGVTPVIKLSDSFTDLEFIWRLNKKYPRVRFCGGHLFCITDCNIGCCGIDILEKKGIDYDIDAFYRTNPCNCALNVCDLKDLSNITIMKDKDLVNKIEHKKINEDQKQVLFSDLLSDIL